MIDITETDASGNEVTSSTHIGYINPIRYRAYYFDVETGLYYLETRYYDPQAGRFISSDNVDYLMPEQVMGLNLYAYCNSNPVMNHWPQWVKNAVKWVAKNVLKPGIETVNIQ